MSGARPLAVGKLPPDLLAELLGALPAPPPELVLGPRPGEDACALELGGATLVVAADPITLTEAEIGRLAVVVNANDVAVCGARPRWFLAVLLLPPGTAEADVRALFAELGRGLERVGAHLVGGHTEITPAVVRPVLVGQMLGLAGPAGVVATGGARPGDALVQVGPVPVEGAAVLARAPAAELAGVSPALLAAARAALDEPGLSVVEAALLAAGRGATALHDPTEGGLAGGLHELAEAAGVRLRVDREAVLWFEPGLALCDALGADPWATLASGSLLAAFPQARLEAALAAFAAQGLPAAAVGAAEAGAGVVDAAGAPLPRPARDEVARLAS